MSFNIISFLLAASNRAVPVADNNPLPVALTSTASPTATGTITSVNDTNADTTILAANAARKGATVFNDSTAILYLALASVTASATNYTVQIAPGGFYELPVARDGSVYTGVIKGIWSADASGAARVTELT